MPRLDGITTAERLRADPRTRHLPVALISACGEGEVTSDVDAFLAKPFEPTELVRVVRQLMNRERKERPGAAGRDGGADGGEEPAAVGRQEEAASREPEGEQTQAPGQTRSAGGAALGQPPS